MKFSKDGIDLINLGNKIKKARLNHNLSQKELSERAGVSEAAISYFESGERYKKGISIIAAYNIMNVLGLSLDKTLEECLK